MIQHINNTKGEHTIKSIHSDNGREFISREMKKWLDKRGITHTTLASHTPEHNNVAECAIQTIVSMARCLLIACGLLQRFWAEAIHMATIIYNMVSCAANDHNPLQLK